MPRHPNQDAALQESYRERRDGTRKVFERALERLLNGDPLHAKNCKLTEANLCREAQLSRSTLNRYQDVKDNLIKAKNRPPKDSPTTPAEKIRELEETIREMRRGNNQTINELTASRDRRAQEVYILNRLIERLRGEIEKLKEQLNEAQKGKGLRVIPSS